MYKTLGNLDGRQHHLIRLCSDAFLSLITQVCLLKHSIFSCVSAKIVCLSWTITILSWRRQVIRFCHTNLIHKFSIPPQKELFHKQVNDKYLTNSNFESLNTFLLLFCFISIFLSPCVGVCLSDTFFKHIAS